MMDKSCVLFLFSSWTLMMMMESRSLVLGVEDFEERSSDRIPGSCPSLPRLDALPGLGLDVLRDEDMGRVFKISYSQCRTTLDGRYLIPNNMEVVPRKSSNYDVTSEIINHWNNFSSLTSDSSNFNLKVELGEDIPINVGAYYSKQYIKVKETMIQQQSSLIRTHLKYITYQIFLAPNSPLSTELESTLLRALAALRANNTEKAEVLLEFVVRDYGTHFIKNIDLGAILWMEDYLDTLWVTSPTTYINGLKTGAEIRFFDIIKANFDPTEYSAKTTVINDYKKKLKKYSVHTLGGPRFEPGMNVKYWSSQIDKNMVAFDKSGEMISHIISPARFPDADAKHLEKLHKLLETIVKDYLTYNIHVGCMSPESPNFDYIANVDGPCDDTNVPDHAFGGVYTECTNSLTDAGNICSDTVFPNPLTGSYRCPVGYRSIQLHNERKTRTQSRYECEEHCRGWWIFKKCYQDCQYVYYQSVAYIKNYWCAELDGTKPETGYLFGGIYSYQVTNILTGSKSCPPKFTPLPLTSSSSVCAAMNNNNNARSSVEFGGFFSCTSGNPLIAKTQDERYSGKACQTGYQQHMVTIEDHCQISYCAKSLPSSRRDKKFIIVRPPFKDIPSRLFQPDPTSSPQSITYVDKGVIAGLVLVVCVICIVACLVIYFYRKQQQESQLQALPMFIDNRCDKKKACSTHDRKWTNILQELQQKKLLEKEQNV